ncbi:hypothetical protein BGZ61DRAFT_540393 [Ilyonectria robusta]|uniref:uncharacterized protein n=1 Tax=Ilyonectria robusta TaxID=1079257 RepID=UPI001E8D15AC|nr:uncharacterized protein BGZ61DRAFT_540393 [Ilyonectria robusta]KAH8658875.1 hypothetical protein BGZ61DRAFT_540393 [Ilyonectria robusta]
MTVTPAPAQPPLRPKPRRLLKAQTTDRRDSGYVTQSPSPDGKSLETTQNTCLGATVDGKARPVPSALTRLADLAEFDKSVGDATRSHFNHMHSRLEEPLLAYIRNKIPGKKYRPIALRLMVLGRSEDDAKPCIVVLCPEQQSKRVRKFFDKDSVRTLCRPEDGTLPSFEVFVLGRPLETKQADEDINVLIPIIGESEGYTTETYCGAPIVIRQPSGVEKRGTFGGVVKTVWSNGDVKLYGLTVGHLLLGDLEDDLTLGTESDGAERSDDWGFELSDSESEAESDDSAEEEPDDETQPLRVMDELQLPSADASASWTVLELGKIGSISKDSPQNQSATTGANGEPKAYYDWALIDMVSYKPNRIRPRNLPHGEVQKDGAFKSGDLVIPASPSSSRQSVVLVSGSAGLKRGSLSALPSRLLLGPGREFVDALVLNLDSDKQILDGDSGSWVVNERTLEVYGYIVAADAFGGGYIIPLVEAFRNIKNTLGCQSVDLATTIDMASAKLERMPDMNGEPAATMAPILAEHSVLRGPPIVFPEAFSVSPFASLMSGRASPFSPTTSATATKNAMAASTFGTFQSMDKISPPMNAMSGGGNDLNRAIAQEFRELKDDHFENSCEWCPFYLHEPIKYYPTPWTSCTKQRAEISHIITHTVSDHGLIRGNNSKRRNQRYITGCSSHKAEKKGKSDCVNCSQVEEWTEGELNDETHAGPSLYLRCYTQLPTKKDLFFHLQSPSICLYQEDLPMRGKSRILYSVFCSLSEVPKFRPPPETSAPSRGARSRTQSVSSDRPSTMAHSPMSGPLTVSPEAAFVAASAASQIVTNDHDTHAETWYDQHGIEPARETALVSSEALKLVNDFLDQLLFNFLSVARATTLSALRPAVAEVLKRKLAKDAVNNSDEELREYLGEGYEEDYFQPQGADPSRDWDLELVWKRTRLRCMVYSSLGDMEEEDEDLYMEQENLEVGADEQISAVISPAVAIFLTSVLEYMGELTLTVAGQAAYHRLRTKFQKEINEGAKSPTDIADRIVVEDQDMERVALDRTLGRLWRGWKKRIRSPTFDMSGRPYSRSSMGHLRHDSNVTEMSRVPSHGDGDNDAKKDGKETDDTERAPAGIALPMGDNDVYEIEVPGLAAYSDDEDEDEEEEDTFNGRRPKSLLILPFEGPSGLPTPVMSQPNTPDFAGRKRSNSLPTSGTSPYRPVTKRSKEAALVEARVANEEQDTKEVAKEEQAVDETKPAEETKPVDEPSSKGSTSKRLSKVVTNPSAAAAFRNRSRRGTGEEEEGKVAYEKAEILTSSRISVSGSASPAFSDSRGPFSLKRSNSVHSARIVDVTGPKSPSGSRSPSVDTTDRVRPASVNLSAQSSVYSTKSTLPTSHTHSIGMVSIERSKTRDDVDDAGVSSFAPRPIHTSGSSASSGTSRLKAVRTSEENASRSENVARNFKELIQSNQTITYTLTPENIRDIDHKRSLGQTPVVTKGSWKTDDARSHNRSRSSSAATEVKTHHRATGLGDDKPKVGVQSPTMASVKPARGPLAAREARVPSEPTADFAEFIKSTGPSGAAQTRPAPLRSNPPETTPSATNPAVEARRVSSTSNRNRYMPRAMTEGRSGNSDLIDFIRQGPPGASNNRIQRTVAPFRDTLDSDEMPGAVGGKAVDATIPDIRYSQASTHATDTSMPSIHSSVNSHIALLKHKGGSAPASRMFDDEDMMPKGKTRRVKDPYAIDFSDEDDDDDFITTPKPPVKKEESLAEFLRNYEPPPEPVSQPIAHKMPKKKASAPSLIGRFIRSSSNANPGSVPQSPVVDSRSLSSRSGGKGYIPIQVNIPPGYDKYGPIDKPAARPPMPPSGGSMGRVR